MNSMATTAAMASTSSTTRQMLIGGTRAAVATAAACARQAMKSDASVSCRRSFSSSSVVQAKPRRQRMANDEFALDKMGKFNFDDIPTLGHEMLNRRRELGHSARLVEWELPKLQSMRKPYEPPSKEAILRLRSLHYQGEAHPVTRKAVLSVKVADLFASGRLTTEAAKRKMLLIAGSRWNPLEKRTMEKSPTSAFDLHAEHAEIEKVALGSGVGTIKISCERFPNERMNVKWCSDAVDRMLREANENPEAMANVPLDLRHVKSRQASLKIGARHDSPTKRDFPAQWLPKKTAAAVVVQTSR